MSATGTHTDANLAQAGFLVVDHKPMAREMVQTALVGRARVVRQTMSVDKAIEILTQRDADVGCVIADWDMLPVGGLELLRMIRCRALANVDPRMGFVVFTGRAEEAAVKCAVELDVNGFATAPLSLDKLARTIGAALGRSWLLQDVAHYAAVPCVVPPPAPADHAMPQTFRARPSTFSPFAHIQPGIGKATVNVRMCGLRDIQPGSVLARDIRDIHGALLLRTGTALDPAILDKLRKAAGAGADRYQVWVRT